MPGNRIKVVLTDPSRAGSFFIETIFPPKKEVYSILFPLFFRFSRCPVRFLPATQVPTRGQDPGEGAEAK